MYKYFYFLLLISFFISTCTCSNCINFGRETCSNPNTEIKAQLIITITIDDIQFVTDICNVAYSFDWSEYVDCGEFEWAGTTCEESVDENDIITQTRCCGYNTAILFQFRNLERAQLLVSSSRFQEWLSEVKQLRRPNSPEPIVAIYNEVPTRNGCYRDTNPSRAPNGADRCSGNYRQHISFHIVEPTPEGRANALYEMNTMCDVMPYSSTFNPETVQEIIHGNFTDLDDLEENFVAPFNYGVLETFSSGFWEPLDVFDKTSDWIGPLSEVGLLGGPDTKCHGEIRSERWVNYDQCACTNPVPPTIPSSGCCFTLSNPELQSFDLPLPGSGDIDLHPGNPIRFSNGDVLSGACNGGTTECWDESTQSWVSTYTDVNGNTRNIDNFYGNGQQIYIRTIQPFQYNLESVLSGKRCRISLNCNNVNSCLEFGVNTEDILDLDDTCSL